MGLFCHKDTLQLQVPRKGCRNAAPAATWKQHPCVEASEVKVTEGKRLRSRVGKGKSWHFKVAFSFGGHLEERLSWQQNKGKNKLLGVKTTKTLRAFHQ